MSTETYPRPDFQRASLTWQSLNGPWSFIFDDEDIGLNSQWHIAGLPSSVELTSPAALGGGPGSDGATTTQKIAVGTGKLVENNVHGKEEIRKNEKKDIIVPYVFQCPASGLGIKGVHEVLWYERQIADVRSAEQKAQGHRVLLRFGAVDYECKIWVNGAYVGGHRGGHVPFDIDVTDAVGIAGQQRLTMRVYDSAYDLTQPRGKQYWGAQPESIFYTPSSGIWQNVWMEAVPSSRIADSSHGMILRSNDIDSGVLHARIAVQGRPAGYKFSVQLETSLDGQPVGKSEIKELPREKDYVNLDVPMRIEDISKLSTKTPQSDPYCWRNNVALWSPEYPQLYDVTVKLLDHAGDTLDTVSTQTGMRSISWANGDGTFRLNGKPIFQTLCLDQGYWPETFMTPPSTDALKKDIELSKAVGLNGCRKHQKVEDPRFLYWADKLGYIVWGEMANAYQFDETYTERFEQEWMESVRRDINHPSILCWTPANESWAYTDLANSTDHRNHLRSLFYQTKVLDPTRPINDNCGWEHVCDDLITFHDYADAPQLTENCKTMDGILALKAGRPMYLPALESPAGLSPDIGSKPRAGAPVICSEFGGVNIKPADAAKAGERDWGYTTATDGDDLLRRVELLIKGVVEGGHCCGYVYTQITDIEQEVNGLYDLERRPKLDVAKLKAVMDQAQKTYQEKHPA